MPRGHARTSEGWAPYYVRNGLPGFVVDQSGRGRSGFDESVVHEGERMIVGDDEAGAGLIPNFGRITSNGSWTAWFGHMLPARLERAHGDA